MTNIIRVAIVDKNPIMRIGLKTVLANIKDIELIAEADNIDIICKKCSEIKPNILLIATNTNIDPVEFMSFLNQYFPTIKVLVLAANHNIPYARRCIKAKVTGFLLKTEPLNIFIHAIRTIALGSVWYSPEVMIKMGQTNTNHTTPATNLDLTPRELEILQLIAQGQTNQEIGEQLNVADRTVRHHLAIIYQKLDVNSRIKTLIKAQQLGLVAIPPHSPPFYASANYEN